jgi:hypothetical protein
VVSDTGLNLVQPNKTYRPEGKRVGWHWHCVANSWLRCQRRGDYAVA